MSRRQVSSRDLDSSVPKIVLIGSTGVGKSRLGSFLVSPATMDCTESELIFRSGADASAVTARLACARVSHSGFEFDVVDTPGLGENATADAKHKTEILHLLKTSPNVAAIIFCFR